MTSFFLHPDPMEYHIIKLRNLVMYVLSSVLGRFFWVLLCMHCQTCCGCLSSGCASYVGCRQASEMFNSLYTFEDASRTRGWRLKKKE